MAYIRTIHTSFTAAHPNPWSRPAAVAPLVNMHQQQPSSYPAAQKYPTSPSPAPPASGAGGRRRAYAFRAPTAQPVCKFDPFGDEPTSPVPNLAALASLSAPPTPRLAAASLPPPLPHHQYHQQQYAVQPQYHYQPKPSSYGPPRRQQPRGGYYTYNNHQQRPRHASTAFVEAPTEIWRSNSPASRAARYEAQEFEGEGGSGISVRRKSPPPPPVQQQPARRTPSPPAPAPVRAPTPSPAAQQQQNRFLHDKDAKAKLVAGILLNRVHAVGRPRRRVPSPVGGKKPYVPSALSQVVACAA